jgi:hypothetical protein
MAVANTVAPEHLQLMVPDDEAPGAAGSGAERRRRVHRPVVAGQPGGLHRRAQPRAADQPHGPLLLGAAGGRLPSTHPRGDVTPDALRALGPPSITLAETEGLPAHADSVRRRSMPWIGLPRTRPRSTGRTVSADTAHPPRPPALRGLPLASGRGRGAPQHQRVPVPATREMERGAAGRAGQVSFNRYPDRPATELRPPSPACTAWHPKRSSAPTGPTRCCSACCWPTGGPGRRACGVRADLRAALAHQPADRHQGGRGRPHRGLPHRPGRSRLPPRTGAARHHVLCSPNNPTGRAEPQGHRRGGADRGAGPRHRR